MSELGQHLKEIREQKNITLDDLQRTTKIQKRYLVAIEEGRFDTLPGLFYARAFVKTYAESIGLDPEPLLDQYEEELPNPQQDAITLPSRSERSKRVVSQPRGRSRSMLPTILSIIVVIVVVVSIWYLAQFKEWGRENNNPISPSDSDNPVDVNVNKGVGSTEDETNNDQEEEEEEEIEEPVDETPKSEVDLTFIESKGKTSYYELKNGSLDDVRIALTGQSHVDVKNEAGHTFYTGMPNEGEDIVLDELANEEHVIFNFGASQNVQLFIRGQLVEFPLDIIHQKVDITVLKE